MTRPLSVKDAAWLCRVNDATVRGWIRAGLATDDSGCVEWDDLAAWAAERGRCALWPDALRLTNEDLVRLEGARPPSEGPSTGVVEAVYAVELRRAMRELLVAATHSDGENAAMRRALGALLDAEETSHRRGRGLGS